MSWGQRIRDQPGLEADRTEGTDWSLRTKDVHRCVLCRYSLLKKICKPSDLQKSKTIISCRPMIVNILYSLDCLPPPASFPPSLCCLSHWKLVEIIINDTLPQNCSRKTDTFRYFYFISPKKVSMGDKWSYCICKFVFKCQLSMTVPHVLDLSLDDAQSPEYLMLSASGCNRAGSPWGQSLQWWLFGLMTALTITQTSPQTQKSSYCDLLATWVGQGCSKAVWLFCAAITLRPLSFTCFGYVQCLHG